MVIAIAVAGKQLFLFVVVVVVVWVACVCPMGSYMFLCALCNPKLQTANSADLAMYLPG
jgi:hypothetical protein